MIPLDSFVGQSADGKMVPIIPGGNSIPLTFSNRKEYVERAIEYRLHEMDRQVRGNAPCMRLVCTSKQEPTACCQIYCSDSLIIYISGPLRRLSSYISGSPVSLVKALYIYEWVRGLTKTELSAFNSCLLISQYQFSSIFHCPQPP